MSTYETDQYYTPLEVADLLGLGKDAILQRCRKGHYEGAYKEGSTQGNPSGQWLIPKRLIDTPHLVQNVATLTRQINPMELERAITQSITAAVTQAVEPLAQKLDEQTETIRQLQASNDSNTQTIASKIEETNKNITELSRLSKPKKDHWSMQIVLLLIILGAVAGVVAVVWILFKS